MNTIIAPQRKRRNIAHTHAVRNILKEHGAFKASLSTQLLSYIAAVSRRSGKRATTAYRAKELRTLRQVQDFSANDILAPE